jgi:hypothetical protein
LLACGAAQGGAQDAAQGEQLQFADPTVDERRSLEAFSKLGWAIYQQDSAAAKGTDAMLALTHGKPDARVRGWVALETPTGHRVEFIAPIDTRLLVIYEVDVPRSGETKAMTVEPPAEASAEAGLQFRARQAVLRQGFPACSKRYNTVVLPGSLLGEHGYLVYALAATTRHEEIVIGGHYRFLVGEDGNTVLKVQPLSKNCLTLERPPGNIEWLVVASLVLPLPNEGHFFSSLLYQTPIVVNAGGKLWKIDPGIFEGR